MSKVAYVYQDDGVDVVGVQMTVSAMEQLLTPVGWQIRKISAEEVESAAWIKGCGLFIMPGGRDIPYLEKLKDRGCKTLRTYVAIGGTYLGFCAGAYFASAAVDFERGTANEVCGRRELEFFHGTAVGQAINFGQFQYGDSGSAIIAEIEVEGRSEYSYFCGGCYFRGAETQPYTEIIGRYSALENQSAAIIKCRYGNGQALLCGPHPEYSYKEMLKYLSEEQRSSDKYRDVMAQLKIIDHSRHHLLCKCLETVGIKCRQPTF